MNNMNNQPKSLSMQEKVYAFIEKYGLNVDPYIRYIDLTSEVGELGKELLKGSNYGKKEYIITQETALELGDTLFPLICIACGLGIDIEEALDRVLKKYENRFILKGDIGSGR